MIWYLFIYILNKSSYLVTFLRLTVSFTLNVILTCVYSITSILLHFRKKPRRMSLETMVKKGKGIASEKIEMVSLFSDTTCSKDRGTSTWESMCNFLEEEKPMSLVTKAMTDAQGSSDTSYFKIACSFLHRITTRKKIIHMVKSVIDKANIIDRTFNNHRQKVLGYFLVDNLQLMYQLLELQKIYNKCFLEQFAKENEDPSNVM